MGDPRVGSARNNASTPALGRVDTGTNSASIASLFSTLVPVSAYAAICILAFLILRRKCTRVYAPRSMLSSLEPHELAPELPSGWFNWIKPFCQIPDTYVLNKSSLDGFLFLRFIKVLAVIYAVGCLITWPILMPIHAYGGGGLTDLDRISMGNVVHQDWFFVHALLAWIYFGFILYMVSRECIYYINLRQAYLHSPFYANRLSSRTVLFTCVPKEYLNEQKLRSVFGHSVKRITIPRKSDELDRLVKERRETAMRLEKAETSLIVMANTARRKAIKAGHVKHIRTEEMTSLETPPRLMKYVNKTATENDITEKDQEHSPQASEKDDFEHGAAIEGFPSPDASGSSQVFERGDVEHGAAIEGFPSPDASGSSQVFERGDVEHAAATEGFPSPEDNGSPRALLKDNLEYGTAVDGSPVIIRRDSERPAWVTEKVDVEQGVGIDGFPLPNVNGSVANQWIPTKSRPYHRPLANQGRRVDTIKWTRLRMKKLTRMITKLRQQQLHQPAEFLPSAFIEFTSQAEAQSAYQTLAHHRPMHMSPRYIGVRPFEIVWSSLAMRWWERVIRRFAMQGSITVMIIFWSIPCAIVGLISNIEFLAHKIIFLHWILDLPEAVLGLLTGLLPAVALSILMSLVPGILRTFGRIAGIPSLSLIELYTQDAYFAFQVVQVFLVTTLTSAVSASFTKILEDPASATTLLSANLPKASNFYISYFLIQNLGLGATALIQISSLFRFHVAKPQSPRLLWLRWHRLRKIHWGKIFPVFTNMAVIALSYSCIAPVILGFAAVGTCFTYVVYRYNLIFVYDSEISTMGLVYPRALMHTLVGVYFAEICMIGLFALNTAFGPLVMMIGLLILTGLIHLSLLEALGPLLISLPRTLAVEARKLQLGDDSTTSEEVSFSQDSDTFAEFEDFDFGFRPDEPDEDDQPLDQGQTKGKPRAIEGADGAISTVHEAVTNKAWTKITTNQVFLDFESHFQFLYKMISPDPNIPPGFFMKWLHPEIYSDYTVIRRTVPTDYPDPVYPRKLERQVYQQPSMFAQVPMLWIPRDPAGVSRQEVAHTGKVTPITDEGASLDEKGGVSVELEHIRDLKEDRDRMRW